MGIRRATGSCLSTASSRATLLAQEAIPGELFRRLSCGETCLSQRFRNDIAAANLEIGSGLVEKLRPRRTTRCATRLLSERRLSSPTRERTYAEKNAYGSPSGFFAARPTIARAKAWNRPSEDRRL